MAEETGEPHRDDGLDLAREIARATASSSPAASKRRARRKQAPTDSTAWATQLSLLAPALVRRLNEELGDGTVTLIDVLGPHVPSWAKGRRRTRDSRGPRDTYG